MLDGPVTHASCIRYYNIPVDITCIICLVLCEQTVFSSAFRAKFKEFPETFVKRESRTKKIEKILFSTINAKILSKIA